MGEYNEAQIIFQLYAYTQSRVRMMVHTILYEVSRKCWCVYNFAHALATHKSHSTT